MSTLDEIRARDLCGMGTPSNQSAHDRRTLLALLDAQSLELQAVREALETAQHLLASLRAYVPVHLMAAYRLDRDAIDAALKGAP